jgi:hypothetical protein
VAWPRGGVANGSPEDTDLPPGVADLFLLYMAFSVAKAATHHAVLGRPNYR